MKKSKILFLIPICMSLLTGCNFSINKYTPNQNSTSNKPQTNNKIEDFFKNPQTTYTDNINSITLQTLYQTCKKSTVTIEVFLKDSESTSNLYSSGSGFIAKESENYLYIYTNAHVISLSNTYPSENVNIEVVLSDYSRYTATIIGSDGNEDVAILRINKPSSSNYLVASIGDSRELEHGESVFAIGSPLGLNYASTITQGIISGLNVKEEADNDENGETTTMYLIQTDTALNPGNSGGPLFNYNGEVIGVNTLKISKSQSGMGVEGISFAIPMNHFEMVATTLMEGKTYTRPKLGISVISIANISLATRQEYNITHSFGLYIDEVTNQNSPLISKTIITHINNKPVYTLSDFGTELYNYKSNDTITITYCNVDGSNSNTINVTLN